MEPIRFLLVYTENSDAACACSVRYFRCFDNAVKAMREDYDRQDAILHFPPSDPRDPFYDEDNNATIATDRNIHVNMDVDSFDWTILDAVPED